MPTQREARDAKRAARRASQAGWRAPAELPAPRPPIRLAPTIEARRRMGERLAAGILNRWAMDNADVVQHPRGRR